MGACTSTTSKKNRNQYYSKNNINNQNINNNNDNNYNNNIYINNINKNNVVPISQKFSSDCYDALRVHFTSNKKKFPFLNFTPNLFDTFENDYLSTNLSPYKFIKNNNYDILFTKLYEITYLKCEAIMGNISENSKENNLFFFRTVFFYFSNIIYNKRKIELSKKLFINCYDTNQNKHNIYILKNILMNFIEVCNNIICYLGFLNFFVNESDLMQSLNDNNYLIENKYTIVELDNFILEKITKKNGNKKKINLKLIQNEWINFLLTPLLNENYYLNYNNKIGNNIIEINKKKLKNFEIINDEDQEEIIYRIVHMLNSENFMEVIFGYEVTPYTKNLYK
jgi:hypothetical protein